MKQLLRALAASLALLTVLSGCGADSKNAAAAPASGSNASDIVGEWKLESVIGTKAGESKGEELDMEENAAKFAEGSGVYTFKENGTGSYQSEEGGGTFEYNGNWTAKDDTTYVFSGLDQDSEYVYDAASDTLHRFYEDETGEDEYAKLEFVFARVK